MRFRAITWNLFHGRDFPPDPALLTWRSRLLRLSERNDTHLQVNRNLLTEFTGLIASADWDVILLQECPPRYASPLCRACQADGHRVLTSRNQLRPLRTALALANPDLIASGEGGSNLTMIHADGPLGGIVERRQMTICERRPERRVMAFSRTSSGICVANLHATSNLSEQTAAELPAAAARAVEWAGEAPLLFGGDLNIRPAEHPAIFDELRQQFGLVPPTAPGSIDHLLGRGLDAAEPPNACSPEAREVDSGGLSIRLSDHAPVAATFAIA